MPIDLTNTAITVTPFGDTLDTRYPAGVLPPTAGASSGFARVPEIFFVEGYEETENLGMMHLDEENLPATGQLWWLDSVPHGGQLRDLAGNPWIPSRSLTLIVTSGSLPAGLAFNAVTGALRFDGRFGSPGDCYAKLADGQAESNVFRIRVLRPTLVFGYGAEAAAAQYAGVRAWADPDIIGHTLSGTIGPAILRTAGANDDSDNVILYLGGDYPSRTAGAPNGLFNKADIIAGYLLGQPNNPPRWVGMGVDDALDPPDLRSGPVFSARNVRLKNIINQRSAPDRNNALTMGFSVPQDEWTYPAGMPYDSDHVISKVATLGTRETSDDGYAPVGLEYSNTTIYELPFLANIGGKAVAFGNLFETQGGWRSGAPLQLTGLTGGFAALNGSIVTMNKATSLRATHMAAWQAMMSTATVAIACATHDYTYAAVMDRDWARASVTLTNTATGVDASFGGFLVTAESPRPGKLIKGAIAIVDEVAGRLLWKFNIGDVGSAAYDIGNTFSVATESILPAVIELNGVDPTGWAADSGRGAGATVKDSQFPGTCTVTLHNVYGQQSGSGGLKHYFYMHGQPNGETYSINARVVGGGAGGIHIKSTAGRIHHWHFFGSPIIDPLNPDLTQTGFADKGLEIGAVSRATVWNADQYLTKWPQGGAGPAQGSTIGFWVSARSSVAAQVLDWPGGELQRLHDQEPSGDPDHWLTNIHAGAMGYRAPYTAGWENRGRTWGNPDYWSEAAHWPGPAYQSPFNVPKFLSNVRFHWIPYGFVAPRNPIQVEGSFPLQAGAFQTSDGRMAYSVPKTWIEPVTVFGHRLTFDGWAMENITSETDGIAINDQRNAPSIKTHWGPNGGVFWDRGTALPDATSRARIEFTAPIEAYADGTRTGDAERPSWMPFGTDTPYLRPATSIEDWANAAAVGANRAESAITRAPNWVDSATRFHYDWMRQRFRIIGQAAGQSLTWVADYLTDSSSWSDGTTQVTGNAGGVMHECATYDPITGDQYLIESAGATLRIHRRADGAVANAWTVLGDGQLPSVLGGNSDILESSVAFGTSGVAMAYTPHLTGCNEPGLVIVCTWGVLGYSLVSNTWLALVTRSAWTSAAGGASNGSQRPWAVYNTATNAVILGNGRTSGGAIWKVALTASGPLASTLATGVTIHLGPDSGSGQCVKIIDDPYRRARLYGLEFGPANTPNLYTISPLTGAIVNVGTHPFDPDDAQNESVLVCAAHGLRSIAALVSSAGQLQLKLWRIA